MGVRRLNSIVGFSIDQVAAVAQNDPEILRLENLDTDLPPPPAVIADTQLLLTDNRANSYLPFNGSQSLRESIAHKLKRETGFDYGTGNVVVTAGGTEGLLDALMAITDPGDEVILTDPTYAGMIYRAQLAGAVTKLVQKSHVCDGAYRIGR
jgi:aspartate/methionine/tyrosine aminotransferase